MNSIADYDAATAPKPANWLNTDESERMRLVLGHHVRVRADGGRLRMREHAALHVVVENQIAQGFGPTVKAVQRLQAQGLTRHQAIHAVGSVLIEHLCKTRGDQRADTQTYQRGLNQAIEQLNAQDWMPGRIWGQDGPCLIPAPTSPAPAPPPPRCHPPRRT